MNNFEKSHAGKGVHFLSGTEWSTEGLYYGFVITGEETVIEDNYLQTGIDDYVYTK